MGISNYITAFYDRYNQMYSIRLRGIYDKIFNTNLIKHGFSSLLPVSPFNFILGHAIITRNIIITYRFPITRRMQ